MREPKSHPGTVSAQTVGQSSNGTATDVRMSRRAFVTGVTLFGAVLVPGMLTGCSTAQGEAPASAETQTPTSSGQADGMQASANDAASSAADRSASAAQESAPASTMAVVYFSMPLTEAPDIDAESGASVVVQADGSMVGNVQYAANYIAAQTGAALIRIEPQVDYPTATPEELIDYALGEQDRNERPAIELVSDQDGSTVESLDAYDTVFVGYPIWWYELPMALYTFFESYDLAGKTVYPFVVHGGSGLSGTVEDIEGLQPDAVVYEDGLSINRRTVAETAEEDVAAWLTEIGLA